MTLLIDAPDGITIVDYKTDRLTTKQVQELGPEYEVQLGLYAWTVEETTGKPVREATLLFLRPQEERQFPDPQALILKGVGCGEGVVVGARLPKRRGGRKGGPPLLHLRFYD